MKLIRIIGLSIKNIISNKLRSFLTILGLIIGVGSVILLVGIGKGSQSSVKSQVQSLGTDILTTTISSTTDSLSYENMDEIAKLSQIEAVAPYKNINATIHRGTTTSSKSSIIATNDNYLNIVNIKLATGRSISIIDIENESKVCILGASIAETLFNLANPVGETIKLEGENYTVIGVLEEQGTTMGTNSDEIVIIPICNSNYFGSDTNITSFYAKVKDEERITMASLQIENYIRSTLQISSDEYSVSSQDSMLSAMSSIDDSMSLLLGGIASISLLVAGIGVMNVMLVSVTERTKEIGIRKSLGAKKRDILFQFLTEALVLSLLGGGIGILFGIGAGHLLENFDYTFEPSLMVIVLAFGASAAIGLTFGIFPAYRAAKLNPIEALREE